MNGNERYILEGIIIVLIAAYIFYENVFMGEMYTTYIKNLIRNGVKRNVDL